MDTLELTFQAHKHFTFDAGQYAYVSVKLDGSNEDQRIFSFVNAPNTDQTLTIAARIRSESAFKQALSQLKLGEYAKFGLPLGFFRLPVNSHIPVICVAGGIGIIPFLSLLENDVRNNNLNRKIHIYTSNKTAHSAAYANEVGEFQKIMPNLRITAHLTQSGDKRINATDIIQPDSMGTVYYLSGTPEMVSDLEQNLKDLGVPLHAIFLEAFTGYES